MSQNPYQSPEPTHEVVPRATTATPSQTATVILWSSVAVCGWLGSDVAIRVCDPYMFGGEFGIWPLVIGLTIGVTVALVLNVLGRLWLAYGGPWEARR